MKIHLLFSGPIRPYTHASSIPDPSFNGHEDVPLYTPGIESVKFVINNYKRQLEGYDIVTYLSTWDNDVDTYYDLMMLFDHVTINEEPTDDHIYENLKERTIQQRKLHHTPNNIDNWTLGIFKMFRGTTHLINYIQVNGLISEVEIATRIRMDCIVELCDKQWRYIFERALNFPNKYFVNFVNATADYSDWFGISMYRNIRKIWHFSDMEELSFLVKNSLCAEMVVKNKATAYRIESVNMKTDIATIPDNYIVRRYIDADSFQKHYYENKW